MSSQRDAELADIARETQELAVEPKGELEQLAAPLGRASLRVLLGGAGAMATTALIGHLLGAAGIG